MLKPQKTRRRLRKLIKCYACGEQRPRQEYLPDRKGSCTTKYCVTCRRLRESTDGTQKDWAYAVLTWLRRTINDPTALSAELTPYALRVIAAEQDHRCALTRVPLVIPEGLAPPKATIVTWAERAQFTPEQQQRIPVLMRVSKRSPWAINNVVLVARNVQEQCRGFQDVWELQRFCSALQRQLLVTVSADTVYNHMKEFDASAPIEVDNYKQIVENIGGNEFE